MEQRSISELITLYKLEPSLRDIVVEGTFDRRLFSWFFRHRDHQRTHIYTIEEIAVPDPVLQAYGLRSGARTKIIALARELDAALPMSKERVTCVVDANCEGALAIPNPSARIIRTDYADLDGYLLNEDTIGKFLIAVLGVDVQDSAELLRDYFDILREPFLVRMAGFSMQVDIGRVDITKSCRLDCERLEVDQNDLMKRMLEKSGATGVAAELGKRVEVLRTACVGDPRRYVNGHEFMALFAWRYASQMRKRGLRDFSALPYVLLNGIDQSALESEVLFRQLRERLQS